MFEEHSDSLPASRKDFNRRTSLANSLKPFTDVACSLEREIFGLGFTLKVHPEGVSPELGDLVVLYVSLEELGVAVQAEKRTLTPAASREWVRIVNLRLDKTLIEKTPPNSKLYWRLVDRTRGLLNQEPANVFHSLAMILRGELTEEGVHFSKSEEKTREILQQTFSQYPGWAKFLLAEKELPALKSGKPLVVCTRE